MIMSASAWDNKSFSYGISRSASGSLSELDLWQLVEEIDETRSLAMTVLIQLDVTAHTSIKFKYHTKDNVTMMAAKVLQLASLEPNRAEERV